MVQAPHPAHFFTILLDWLWVTEQYLSIQYLNFTQAHMTSFLETYSPEPLNQVPSKSTGTGLTEPYTYPGFMYDWPRRCQAVGGVMKRDLECTSMISISCHHHITRPSLLPSSSPTNSRAAFPPILLGRDIGQLLARNTVIHCFCFQKPRDKG
jgi:hypothetical protein